jgi:hypothetical protein
MPAKEYIFILIICLFLVPTAHSSKKKFNEVLFQDKNLDIITINNPNLYPEGITYNNKTQKFIVGSFTKGTIYEVDEQGSTKALIQDNRLISTLGLHIDEQHNKLYAATSDIGIRAEKHPKGLKFAAVGIYNLETLKPISFVDLGGLMPDDKHLANSITTDPSGNAYITDSYAPVIYKIDPQGRASILLKSNEFLGEGINLNGIIYNPEGYLIAIKKNDGRLFKIPLDNPENFSQIHIKERFYGGDGLILANKNELILTTNNFSNIVIESVYSLTSTDNWQSATILSKKEFDNVYLTTGVIKNNKIYIMYSYIKRLLQTPASRRSELQDKAIIQQVGIIKPNK